MYHSRGARRFCNNIRPTEINIMPSTTNVCLSHSILHMSCREHLTICYQVCSRALHNIMLYEKLAEATKGLHT